MRVDKPGFIGLRLGGRGSRSRIPAFNRKTGDGGFTIIEVLIASVILIVALVGFLSVALATTNLGGKNAKVTGANALIYQKYESLRLDGFDAVADSVENSIDIDQTGAIVPGVYTRTVTVAQFDAATPLSLVKRVTITIDWPGHTMTQSTIMMKEK